MWDGGGSTPYSAVLLVGIGGTIGAILRYLVAGAVPRSSVIPTGTLTVNVIGSFILSYLTFSGANGSIVHFVNIGILGSFTTFSTFSYESFRLLEENELTYFVFNIGLNLFMCLASVKAGQLLVNLI
ncbi:fluoride efflux transporter FluC [Methanomethylovorans sp. PtaU1.Bin093]|uniref:fluoride efflux transporter FluC n=1 Tax=Methanomethylovorans sp. PtaU1.Bin093 TaxID=1811679 RepID=UPI00373FDFD0